MRKINIAIIWEQFEYGGVDSYLSYLLNNWNKEDDITLFYNAENLGAIRLRDKLIKNDKVKFQEISTVFNFFRKKSLIFKLLRIINFFLIPILFIFSIYRYTKIFKKRNFDILLAQNGGYPGSYGSISSIFAAKICKVKVKLMVVHHSAVKPELFTGWYRLLIDRNLANHLNKIICISDATKETIINFTRILDDQKCTARVIHNGIELKDFKYVAKEKNNKTNILILSRLNSYKGHDDFLNAVSLLDKKIQINIKINFVGSYNDIEKKKLEKLYKELSISSEIKFHGYDDRDLSEIYGENDLTVMPTNTFEGFGLTILESIKYSTPVITSNLGVAKELFESDSNFLFYPGNVLELSSKLETFINSSNGHLISDFTLNKIQNFDIRGTVKSYRTLMISEYLKNE